MREQVQEIIGTGQHAPSGNIPFTPRAKKVLELSLREAMQLGDNYIGTEHILLGLIREGEGVAAQVLIKLDGNLNKVRQQVIGMKAGTPTTEEMPAAAAGPAESTGGPESACRAESARRVASARRAESAGAASAGRAERPSQGGRINPAESASLTAKLTEALSRLDSISDRLTGIERALGIGTAPDDD